MKHYTIKAIEGIVKKYRKRGGKAVKIKEGSLGFGEMVLFDRVYKTIVIKEVYLNGWSSSHTIRFYEKTPRKYLSDIETSVYGAVIKWDRCNKCGDTLNNDDCCSHCSE